MTERDLLEAFGALSDETIKRTVLTPEKAFREKEDSIFEIERLVAKKPDPPVKTAADRPERIQSVSRKKKIRMRIPTTAVVAACVLLNVGILCSVYRMKNKDAGMMQSTPVATIEEKEPEEKEAEGPYAEVLADSASPIGCTLLLHNPTDETITYGESFYLYNDKGEEINSQTFSAERYEIKPGGTGKLNCWYATYASLVPEKDRINAFGLSGNLYDDEIMQPLDPGKYEIEVGFITSSEYIQFRRADLIVSEDFENKRPLMYTGTSNNDVMHTVFSLQNCGISNYEIIAQPVQDDQSEQAGAIQKIEPVIPGDGSDLNPGIRSIRPVGDVYLTNPEDIIWIDQDETVRIYVSTGSHDPDTVVMPVMDSLISYWDYRVLEQYLVTAGLHIVIQYEELPVNSAVEGEYYYTMLGLVSKVEPSSTESQPAKLRRGDTVTVYVYGSEEQLGYQKAYAEQAITWALEQAVSEMDREQAGGTVQLPDLTGMDYEEAKEFVQSIGLYAEKHSVNDPETPRGKVSKTTPACPAEVESGTCIMIYISDTRADSVVVPEFTGMTMQQANDIALDSDYHLDFTMKDGSEPYGTIVWQQIAPGDMVVRGSWMEVYVSNGNG